MPQFLHPFLLWGAFAAAVPVLIHLLHRRRFVRQRWAAMEWLLAAAKQNQKRLQMENLLLLLVRTLAVLFLALAVARPTFSDAPILLGPAQQTHLWVLLDNSGSMAARAGTRTSFDDALTAVSSLVADLGDDDPVSLVLTNDNWGDLRRTGRPRMILRETRDRAAVRRRLGELRPAPARADLAASLKLIEEAVPATGAFLKKVALVTDLQEVSLRGADDRSAADDPVRQSLLRLRDKGAEVVLVPSGREVANVAVTALRPAEDRDVVQGTTAVFQAEIRNYSDRPQKVEVRFVLDGEERGESAQWVNVPARTAGPDAPPAATAQYWTRFRPEDVGTHVREARIRADGMPLDDSRAFAFSVRPRLQVLVVDGDPAPTAEGAHAETFWLAPALAFRDDGPIAVRTVTEGEYHALRELTGWDMVILANVERPAPTDEARARLESYVQKGGALLLTVGDHVVADRWNEELWRRPAANGTGGGLLPARLSPARVDAKQVLRFDLKSAKHPLLANICDPEFAVFFESPVLTGHMPLEGIEADRDARVALRYDDLAQSAAIAEKRFGRGRVLLLTTTVDDAWGRLPGAYIYPALLHECVYWTTTRGDAERNLLAFQPWIRGVSAGFASMEVVTPDGTVLRPERDSAGDESTATVVETGQLGVYRSTIEFKAKDLFGAAPPPEKDAFTVQLTPVESDLRRSEPDQVLARYRDLIRTGSQAEADAQVARSRAGEIAIPLIAAALACLLLEVVLVRRIGRRRAS